MSTLRGYTRWTEVGTDGDHTADILGGKYEIAYNTRDGAVLLGDESLSPDEARMYGVRLIEAAALADGPRSIRRSAG